MVELLSGTITLFFTDIEGSTRLMLQREHEYPDLLAHHRSIVRDALIRHGGVEVDTQGDAFFAVFRQAPAAIAAAQTIQTGLASGPIRMRVGIHTGKPLWTGDGYVGPDVHLAARVCAAAHGGQVVISEASRLRVRDAQLKALGLHQLKDIPEPIELHQLGFAMFPPLRTMHATNLPVQPVSLIGREQLLAEFRTLLVEGGPRLITLVGPGGIGKTSVASTVAAERVPLTPAGVYFVDLTRLREPSQVVPAIAQTIGATGDLAEHIGSKAMLLLLDNMEHVIEAAEDVAWLLGRCPNLRLIVTSRTRLHVRGEWDFPVDPLPEDASVALFLERARAVDASVAEDEAVIQICRRLDGLPLAIELAASRVAALSTQDLLRRLDDRLTILAGGPRDVSDRQQTLRATVEWSVDLLPPGPRALFPKLAVFVGGWTLDAAEQISDASLDDLGTLVDHSLVQRRANRYGMLETILELAAEEFIDSATADKIRERHARYFLEMCRSALAASPTWGMVDDTESFHVFRANDPNLVAAARWLHNHAAGKELSDIAIALWRYWLETGATEGGERWIQAALDLADDSDSLERLWLLGLLAEFRRYRNGDYRSAIPIKVQALEMSRRVGDNSMTAAFLADLTIMHAAIGEFGVAQRLGDEALELRRAGAGEHGMEVGRGIAHALQALAELAMRMDEPAKAEQLLREADDLEGSSNTPPRDRVLTAFMIEEALRRQGRLDEARAAAVDVLGRAVELDHPMLILETLVALAGIYSQSDPETAGAFLGAVDALQEQVHLVPFDPDEHRQMNERVRSALGDEANHAAARRGRSFTPDELIALASNPAPLLGSPQTPAGRTRGDR